MNTSQGSAGNVLAALASFLFPGLGQLLQGRLLAAFLFFLTAAIVWLVSFGTMGWIIHIWACVDAAVWHSKED